MNYGDRALEAIFSGFIIPASSALVGVFKHGTTDYESVVQNRIEQGRGGLTGSLIVLPKTLLRPDHNTDTADRSIDGSTFNE